MAASTENFKHDYSKKPPSDEGLDPVEEMLKKTGCIDFHYAVQECMAENRDWRKCQSEVRKFQTCMEENTRRRMQQ